MENAFLASGGEFVFKKVGALFHINPAKIYGLTAYDLFREKGTTPVVVNSSINNGIGVYVARKPTRNRQYDYIYPISLFGQRYCPDN
ncbi:hypothetical protein [Kingella kingae]|uniref:hypothetical protein n=1 Tax=Kingella kingae TaxID=504 RepID=UPI001E53AE07|nr:hypothetical protein [Kingella kingae]